MSLIIKLVLEALIVNYNKGVKHRWGEYKISVHHILWPVPASAINANTQGVINQNIGYPGAETNQEPLKVPL